MRDGDIDAATHYATLELRPSATRDEIRQSFRRLILLHHPDRQPSGRTDTLDSCPTGSDGAGRLADTRAEALNTAYHVLYDPEKRTAYDQQLRLARAQSAASQAASHGTVSQTVSIDDFVTREEADADSERAEAYYYPSRCGDDFRVGVEQLEAGNGEVVLGCEGCTERIRVVYEIASEE